MDSGWRENSVLVLVIISVVVVAGVGGYFLFFHEGGEEELEPASFSTSSLSVSPQTVEPDETVTVSVVVSNSGEEAGEYAVELMVNGEAEDSRTVSLEGGESRPVEFSVTRDTAGEFSVGIGDLSGSFTVERVIPRIYTEENRLVAGGERIRLRGVSIADPYYLDTTDDHFSEEIFAELEDWNANVVRVPVHPGWWKDEPDYPQKYLDNVVDWGEEYGLYIILEWHAIGNPLTGRAQETDWYRGDNPPVYDPSLDIAENFWIDISSRYGGKDHVIFEIFNEPTQFEGLGRWPDLSEAFNDLIDEIRKNATETLVLVSGWEWTHDLTGYTQYPIQDNNFAYVAHWYPANRGPQTWESSFGFMTESHPVVVTEWGFSPTATEQHYYGTRENFGNSFLRYLERKNMEWLSWCFHPTWGPRMIEDWTYEPTSLGLLVKQALASDDIGPEVTIDSPSEDEQLEWTADVEGTTSDDTGLLEVQIKIDNGSFKRVDSSFNSDYTESQWVYRWKTNLFQNGEHTLTVRAVDTSLNSSTNSVTVNVSNPVDEVPPLISIEKPSSGASVSGSITISGQASDEETGIRYVEVLVDNKSETAWNSSSGTIGVFSDASFEDGRWRLTLNTTVVSNGSRDMVVRAVDQVGNVIEDSVTIEVNNGTLVDTFDKSESWVPRGTYLGGGASFEVQTVEGVENNATKGSYKGSSGAWWMISKNFYKDFSDYAGIKFKIKGDPYTIRMMITDSGNEQWVTNIVPSESWEEIKIPFENFQVRPDWQAGDAERNNQFDLDGILNIQVHESPVDQEESGTFVIDEMRLYE